MVCVTLQYRLAEMKGMHKMRLSPISAYRKNATAVHWRVMVISWRETDTEANLSTPADRLFSFKCSKTAM